MSILCVFHQQLHEVVDEIHTVWTLIKISLIHFNKWKYGGSCKQFESFELKLWGDLNDLVLIASTLDNMTNLVQIENQTDSRHSTPVLLEGKFPQTTMWIGWVECNFRNPSVKVWADLDNPFKRSDYAKLCMSPSLNGTVPEYVISQEDKSPLTLYIDFHNS